MVSEIQCGQTFSRLPAHPPIRTPWVKTIPGQPLKKEDIKQNILHSKRNKQV